MGVSPERVILVNSIFQKYLWETPGIGPVYAVFSPVRLAGCAVIQQPLVLAGTSHHYRLCFRSVFREFFDSAHSFHFGTLWSAMRSFRFCVVSQGS
jgi:hypothetical protein